MASINSLSASIPGHSNTLTAALFIALSIICGLTFLFTTRLDPRLPIACGYLTLLAVSLATAFGPDILPTLWPKLRQQPKRRK
jgi:hypothetical protein